MGQYWKRVWRKAWLTFSARLREGRRNVAGWVIQTAAFFALLYFAPWLGDFVGEAKLAGAALVGSIAATTVVTFGWELVSAPHRLQSESDAQIAQYASLLQLETEHGEIRRNGMTIYEIGKQAYVAAHGEDRRNAFEAWERQALDFLKCHYDDMTVINFQTGIRFQPGDLNKSVDVDFAEKLDRFVGSIGLYSPKGVLNRDQLVVGEPS